MRNAEVIQLFLSKQSGVSHNKNLRSHGTTLVNYRTTIAYWSPAGQLWVNERGYSMTTTTIVNKLRREADNRGIQTYLYTGEGRF